MTTVKLKGFLTVRQQQGHTCGLCAMTAVYRYYGLKPKALMLRERLGTDNHALPYCIPMRNQIQAWLESKGWNSQGTLPMDVFAVLYWDGFDSEFRTGCYANFTADIYHNLKTGHPVLALVAGLKHWVVITGMDQKGVWVADSIGYIDPDCWGRLSFKISHREFGDQVCGVVLVKRRRRASIRDMTNTDFVREYIRGAKFGAGCLHKVVPPWLKWLLPAKHG